MAAGDVILQTELVAVVKLLDAATANTDGAWIDCGAYLSGSVTVTKGGGTISITVQGTDAATKPAAATDAVALATALSDTGRVEIPVLPRYLKADGTITTGPVTVIATLRR